MDLSGPFNCTTFSRLGRNREDDVTERTIDYERNRAFWHSRTSRPGFGLDYVAGRNPAVPELTHARFRARQLNCFDEWVVARLRPSIDVLDLGCGPGTWALHLAPRVRSVLGVDLAPAFVAHARGEAQSRGLTNTEFQQGSFLDLQPGRRFGLILLGAVLHHVGDGELQPLLRSVRGWLAPEGRVYARVAVAPRRAYQRRGDYQAIYRTRQSYETCFRGAGFRFDSRRDLAYTDATLAALYFAVIRSLSLGLLRERALNQISTALERIRPLSFGLPRRCLDLTPLPRCYHYLLEPTL